MKEKTYTRLSFKERTQIESYLILMKSVTEISLLLNRPKSTISREIARGLAHPGSRYNAEQSHWHSIFQKRTRRVDSKISLNTRLRFYIIRRLKLGWSPEQIANRVRYDCPEDERMRISHESIYKYIYCETNGRLQKRLIALLAYNKPKRIGGSNTKIYMGTIIGRTSIDERPKSIEDRTEEGHWEGDLIVGKDQKSVIGTLVERKTRYTIIVPLESRKSMHVTKEFAKEMLSFPANFRRTLTYDNGIEMSAHKDFAKRTKIDVYFAHPYSSWERGTNENTNGLIRRVFKKKTDFRTVSPQQLKELEKKLNNRPRKVLNWKTPFEMLVESCA